MELHEELELYKRHMLLVPRGKTKTTNQMPKKSNSRNRNNIK
jgi:hypothetical protein